MSLIISYLYCSSTFIFENIGRAFRTHRRNRWLVSLTKEKSKEKCRRRKDEQRAKRWKAERKNCAHGYIMRTRDRTKPEKARSTKPKRKDKALAGSHGRILKIIHHRPASAVTFNYGGRYSASDVSARFTRTLFQRDGNSVYVFTGIRIRERRQNWKWFEVKWEIDF